MDDHLTIRFTEFSSYDATIDGEVVKLMAVTNKGTYYADVPIEGKPLRIKREAFKTQVMDLIDQGHPPCEVSL